MASSRHVVILVCYKRDPSIELEEVVKSMKNC